MTSGQEAAASGTPGLRQRMLRGAQAQVFGQVVRVLIQVGGIPLLIGLWGVNLYGEWLILAAVPNYLTFSGVGLFAVASNDMIMKVSTGDRAGALNVFNAASGAVGLLVLAVAVVLPVGAALAPLAEWFHFTVIDEVTAGAVVVLLGVNTCLTLYGGILYGGYACEGRYGEAAFALAGVTLAEFAGLAAVVALGGGPALAAAAMLGTRLVATVVMYDRMRGHAPWLRFGRPVGAIAELRRLLSPGLATAGFLAGHAINLQGVVVLVGAVSGPVSVAVFSTLRTMSRVVFQILSSVFQIVAPEMSRAYAAGDHALLRELHRRGCQSAVWAAVPILAILAVFGLGIVSVWTHGEVKADRTLLLLFLAIAALDTLWYTSLALLFATNRLQRAAAYFLAASVASLPVAYVLLEILGLDGVALSLVLLDVVMVVVVVRQALPLARDTWRGWLGSIVRPPLHFAELLRPGAKGK